MRYHEIIDEAPSLGDTFSSSMRAYGQRLGHGVVAGLGSYFGAGYKSRGKLTARIITDRIMQGWQAFSGGTNQPATPTNLYNYLSRKYAKLIDDKALRQILGLPPAPPPEQKKKKEVPWSPEVYTFIKTLFDAILAAYQRQYGQQQGAKS